MSARVLIVDDEPTVRMTLRYALDESAFSVTEVDSGEAALDLPSREQFDLYLLDKNLPGISGVDLARQVRAHDPAAAILLITGYATVDSAVEAMGAGADGYLEKPFDDITGIAARMAEMVALTHKRRASGTRALSGSKRLLVAGGGDCQLIMHAAAALDGVSVSIAADKGKLLQRLDETPLPDMLLVDDGIDNDLFSFLQTLMQRVPFVVAVKTRPSVDDADHCMRLGIKGLLQKPLARPHLDERLKELVAQLTK